MADGKTPDEIKKEIVEALEKISWIADNGDAHDLIDACWMAYSSMADALALIRQYEAQNANLLEKVEQLQAERDAAVADISKGCFSCKHGAKELFEEPCNSCRRAGGNKENWQWQRV